MDITLKKGKMNPETKDRLFQLEISLAIIAVLVIGLSFFKPSITGFVPVSVYTETLNLTISKDTAFTLFSNEQIQVTSLKLSGEVIGDGAVHVYLSNTQGQNLLVYSNLMKNEFGKNIITGMAVAGKTDAQEKHSLVIQEIQQFNEDVALPDNEGKIAESGRFDGACVETCSIIMDLSGRKVYKLIIVLEENAVLRIDNIVYTINE